MQILKASPTGPTSTAFEIPCPFFQIGLSQNQFYFSYANECFERELELFQEDLQNNSNSFTKLLCAQDSGLFFASVARSSKNLSSWQWQGCFTLPSGKKKWMQGSGVPFKTDDGRFLLNCVFTDVTEIRHTHEMFKAAGKLSKTGAWELDLVAQTLYWSEEVYHIHERDLNLKPKLEEAINYYLPEARPIITAAVEKAATDGKSWDLELPIVTEKGNQIWVRAIGEGLLVNNKVVKLFGVFQDITERKSTAEIIERSEAMLAETQELTHCGSWEADLLTGKNYWSAEAFRIFGLKPEGEGPSLLTFEEMIHPEDRGLYFSAIKRALKQAQVSSFDLRIIWPSGEVRNIHAIGKPFINKAGAITKLYGAIVDITERKAVEREVIKAKELAEQASVAKAQFLSTMSHEIRTPMNAVVGFTNLLMQKNPTPEQLEYLNIIQFSGDNLLVLINDILDFSKIEEGKIEFEQTNFNLEDLLVNICKPLLQKANEKGLAMHLLTGKNLPEKVIGDPVRLGQIFTNLINNAIKFTPTGKITVSTYLTKQENQNATLNFEVADTGIGIAEDKLQYIFERFTQAASDTTRQFGGTGLGLTITKKLIELQGGNIQVESEIGKGAVFKFSLTFETEVAEDGLAQPPAATAKKSLKGINILLAEDNDINILLVKQFMKLWEASCTVAKNGLEAVKKVRDDDFDLILMDLQMPEMDGYEATETIRNMPEAKYKQIPIIALTASAMIEIQHRTLQSGMNDYVSKPFNPNDLYQKIASYCKK